MSVIANTIVEHNICTLPKANDWLTQMIEMDYQSPVTDLTLLCANK